MSQYCKYLEYKKVRFSKIPSEEMKKILTILDESSKKICECYRYPDPDLQLDTSQVEQKAIIFLSIAEIFVALFIYAGVLPASAVWIILGIPLFIGLWGRIAGEYGIVGPLLNKGIDMLLGSNSFTLPPEIESISSQMKKLYKNFEEIYKLCQYSEQLKSFLEEKGKNEKLSFYLDDYGCMGENNLYIRKNGCKESMCWEIDSDMYDRIFSDKNMDFGKTHQMLEECFERLHQITQDIG